MLCLTALLSVHLPADGQVTGSLELRFQVIRSLIDSGKYVDAELEADNLFSALDSAQEAAPSDRLQAIDLLVEALACNGRGAEARTRTLAEQVIRAKEARTGASHLILAPSLRNFGDVLIQAGDYQAARVAYERALSIRKLALGPDHPDVADDLDGLVRALTLIERYDDALAASDEALRIKEKALALADVRIARTLEIRGLLLQSRGDYSNSRLAIERALTIRESANAQHVEIAATFSLFGEQQRLDGDLVRAKQFGERAVAVGERALRPDHPDIAVYLRRLARPVADMGDLGGARALRERALAIADKALGSEHPLVAVQMNDLANIFFLEGDYSQARALYARALRTYERQLGPDHGRVTTVVYNLALVSQKLGDFPEARRQFNRAMAAWQRVLGPAHVFVGRAAEALAEMLSDQGLDAQATVFYERALAIWERALGTNHPDVARLLIYMSTSVARLGQSRRAYELSTRALQILEQASEPDTQVLAEALSVDGTLKASQRDYLGARTSYDRALLTLQRSVGGSHPDVAAVRLSMAAALANTNQSEGLGDAMAAEEIGRAHLRLMLRDLPERQGLEYAAKRPKGLDFALSLVERVTDRDERPRVFDDLIRSRGLVLDEMAKRRHLSADAKRAELAPLWATLVSARQRAANLAIRGVDEKHAERSAAALDEARREKEDAERAFADKSAAFREELSRVEIGLNEVLTSLPPNSAVIAYARYDRTRIDSASARTTAETSITNPARPAKPVPSYIAFILRPDQPGPAVVPLGPASTIDPLVASWQQEATGILRARSAEDADKSYRAAGTTLRQRVWDPIRKYVNGAETVFIVPDGTLNLVSYAALPVGETSYLIDRGPVIHYLSAERDLVAGESPAAAGRGLLAVGGAAFDDATLFARASKPSSEPTRTASTPTSVLASRSSPFDRLRAGCGTLQSLQFTQLAGTSREAHDVARLWTGSPAEILESRAANERAFKREAPGHRVLHLATHGFFLGSDCTPAAGSTRSVGGLAVVGPKNTPIPKSLPKNAVSDNPLLMSGLALAGANRRAAAGPDDEDGILTAEEVSALNLEGVEWAVLSACETGLGEVKAGEGVFGLRRAFQIAGVRTVIMSLWSVDDNATRLWMRALYRNRLQKHVNTAEAMRAASLSVLRDRRAHGQSTHPFYWGAFVAAGDWR